MIGDIWTVVRKEWKELLLMRGSMRGGTAGIIIFMVLLGIVIPYQMGLAWVETPLVLFYSFWFPFILVSSIVADAFAGERERHTLETLLASRLSDRAILAGKILSAVSYAWGMVLGMLMLGLVTVNVTQGHGRLLTFSPAIGFASVVVSLLVAIFVASAGVIISLRSQTVRQAQQTLSLIAMAIFFVPLIGIPMLPESWKAKAVHMFASYGPNTIVGSLAATVVVLDLIFLALAAYRFQRSRLILD